MKSARLICLTLAAAFVGPAAALSAADVYALVAPSVWRVQTLDEDGLPLAMGSAVVVGPDTLATNCHVLARAHRVQLKHDDKVQTAQLSMWDPERDICQLHVSGLGAPAVTLAEAGTLRVGQPAFSVGHPAGLDLTIGEGLLSGIRRNDRQQIVLLQTSAPFSLGSSGGGLFDDQGRLLGLTTLVRSAPLPNQVQSLNFAVPAEWITQLPQRFARSNVPAGESSDAAEADKRPFALPADNALLEAARRRTANPPSPRDLADDSRLPWSNEKLREAYRDFVTRKRPRAFVINELGGWYSAWNSNEVPPGGIMDPAQRAMLGCQRRAAVRCHLYAVDDRVVYDPPAR
jgi:serine protease Do